MAKKNLTEQNKVLRNISLTVLEAFVKLINITQAITKMMSNTVHHWPEKLLLSMMLQSVDVRKSLFGLVFRKGGFCHIRC